MIKAIDYEKMVKAIAAFLDDHSGIEPTRMLNADSIRGADLSEMISESQSYSPEASKPFALFEIAENTADGNFATKGEEEASITTIQRYDLHLKIYGNQSPAAAQRLFAAFKQEDNALALRDKGVFVVGVAPIEAVNEFVNNTWLLRRDMTVKLQVRFDIGGVSEDPGIFDESQSISAIVLEASRRN